MKAGQTCPENNPGSYPSHPIADDGTNESLTLPLPIGNRFFRLLPNKNIR